MNYAAITDIGLTRDKNQDSYIVKKNQYGDVLALVCDGIGGGLAGEVASSEVVKYFDFAFESSGPFSDLESIINYLDYHIALANRNVYDLSRQIREYRGMGTTLTGILISEFGVLSINCGDSRVYGFLDNKVFHLTNDHTLVNRMLENGEITIDEAENHPKRHYLVNAIGIFDKTDVDIHKVKDLDYYLICSDGLHGLLSDDEISKVVYEEGMSLDQKVEALKDLALLKGGYDNITVILVER